MMTKIYQIQSNYDDSRIWTNEYYNLSSLKEARSIIKGYLKDYRNSRTKFRIKRVTEEIVEEFK